MKIQDRPQAFEAAPADTPTPEIYRPSLKRRLTNVSLNLFGLRHLHGTKIHRGIRSVLDEIDLQHVRDSHPCMSSDTREEFYRYIHNTSVISDPIDYLEFGVFRGESMRQWVKLNRRTESRFFGFDSFEGLPENWRSTHGKGAFSVDGVVPNIVDQRVRWVKGWFDKTIPDFVRDFIPGSRLVLHIDADLYSSAMLALVHLTPFMKSGTLILFDEFYDREHEFKAFRDWQRIYGKKVRIVAEMWNYVKVCMEVLQGRNESCDPEMSPSRPEISSDDPPRLP